MPIADRYLLEMDLEGTVVAQKPAHDGFRFAWSSVVNMGTGSTQAAAKWWVNPLDYTLQLKPLQMLPDWKTSGTAANIRLALAAFTSSGEITDWEAFSYRCAGDTFFLNLNNNHDTLTSNRTYKPNQAFFITFRNQSAPADEFEMIRIGFGGYTLSLYSEGWFNLSEGSGAHALGAGVGKRGYFVKTPHDCSREMVQLLIQPYKARKILIWSPSHGGGCIWTDPRLPAKLTYPTDTCAPSNEITAAGPLTVSFPSATGIVQPMHAVYPWDSGGDSVEFTTPVVSLTDTPAAIGVANNTDLWEMARDGGMLIMGIMDESTTSLWTAGQNYSIRYQMYANKGTDDCRAESTPFIYGARILWPVGTGETRTGVPLDPSSYMTALSISHSPGANGLTGSMTLKDTDTLFGAGKLPYNRLIRLSFGADVAFLGFARNPKRVESTEPTHTMITFDLVGLMNGRSEEVMLPSRGPFDGMLVADVVKYLFELMGATETTDYVLPELGDLRMPDSGHPGSFVCVPEGGDTVGVWLRRIETLTGYQFMEKSVAGAWVYVMYYPSDTEASAKTLYQSRDGVTPAEHEIVRGWLEDGVAGEATCIGLDYCTDEGKHVLLEVCDDLAEDPAPSGDRPENWWGERKQILLRDNHARNDAVADLIMSGLIDRPGVMDAIVLATCQSHYDPALWPMGSVTVVDKEAVSTVWKILQMNWSITRDATTPERVYWRPCTYILERKAV